MSAPFEVLCRPPLSEACDVIWDPFEGPALFDQTGIEGWHRGRALGIGASDSGGILNCNPRESGISIYAAKVHGITKEQTNAMELGHLLEEWVISKVAMELGCQYVMDGRLLRSKAWPWMLCTLDGWLVFPDGRWVVIDAKTTGLFHEWLDGTPMYIWVQLQHQMVVIGGSYPGMVGVLDRRTAEVWHDPIARDRVFAQDILVPDCREFWDRVEAKDPPGPDASERARQALAVIFPKPLPEADITLPTEASRWHLEIGAIDERTKGLKDRRQELRNLIQFEMKDAERGYLPGRDDSYTNKVSKGAKAPTLRYSTKGRK